MVNVQRSYDLKSLFAWRKTRTKDVHVLSGKEREDSSTAKIRPPEKCLKNSLLKSGSLEWLVPKAGLCKRGLLRYWKSRQSSLSPIQYSFSHLSLFATLCLKSTLLSSLANTYLTLDLFIPLLASVGRVLVLRLWVINNILAVACAVYFSVYAYRERPKRLPVADEIRNFCVTSQLEDSKQIEEILALAS